MIILDRLEVVAVILFLYVSKFSGLINSESTALITFDRTFCTHLNIHVSVHLVWVVVSISVSLDALVVFLFVLNFSRFALVRISNSLILCSNSFIFSI